MDHFLLLQVKLDDASYTVTYVVIKLVGLNSLTNLKMQHMYLEEITGPG